MEAQSLAAEMTDLASTLLGAIVGQSGAAFFQIGDGAIVFRQGDSYEHVFWPSSGEYANMTYFLTNAQFAEHLEFVWLDRQVDEVAFLTDGLQRLAMDFRAAAPTDRSLPRCFRGCGRAPTRWN